ncbi:response regulator [Pseudoroseomonas cervicalis]|uniref:response regulator n=1 Tax=Teichococcus cervicalis TaxID=204525 RepID=UPI002785A3FA|nr:response regulator transcription factor [Pseudoroseomonas cervicalis]MDQ1081623.1 two-component system OmpR family response regulator [Pseudoroseomonas cervicalis]
MTPMPHVLIVDDDEDILSLLTQFLQNHSCSVSVARRGEEMFARLEAEPVSVVILDVMLQGENGFDLCRRLRAQSGVPVIMLTAMSEHTDRVVGLEIGADDYLTKPFSARELLARIKAVLRRATAPQPAQAARPVLGFGRWRLDIARRELRAQDNTLVFLSAGEFDLLLAFAEHPQRVLTRDMLMDLTRGESYAAFDRSIDVQISRLRRKLEADPKTPELIRTVRNGGYILMAAVVRL